MRSSETRRLDKRIWIPSAIIFVVLTCAGLESFDAVSTAILGILLLGGPLAGLAAMAWGAKRKQETWIVAGAHLLAVPILAGMLSGKISHHQYDKTTARGDLIVAALEAHRTATGRYPSTLAELVPQHLPEVPLTKLGLVRQIPFSYKQTPNDAYTLNFIGTSWTICQRDKQTPWACDD